MYLYKKQFVECIFIIHILTFQTYLKRYNYLRANNPDPRVASLTGQEAVTEGLKRFQHMAGIEVTGELFYKYKYIIHRLR